MLAYEVIEKDGSTQACLYGRTINSFDGMRLRGCAKENSLRALVECTDRIRLPFLLLDQFSWI